MLAKGLSLQKGQLEKRNQSSAYPDNDHSLTSPSPPPDAKLTPSGPMPIVASGCQAAPPIFSECPLLVDIGLRFGMSQTLQSPVQEAVRRYCELGEKRIHDRGLSSPNWDPRLLNVCRTGQHRRDALWCHLP